MARLFGTSLPERAEALIGIDRPDVREHLARGSGARFRSSGPVLQAARY